MIIHQIFGLMGDTEMNELFSGSHKTYIDFCKTNNYQYILWDNEMCNKLIDEYLDYKELYNNVKYPIMKVDIIRFLILHKHGGLYADLDTKPIIDSLREEQFIIAKKYGLKRTHYEMEILQSSKGHPYLLEFLNYVKTQIEEKDKVKIYEKWKCRYVYQTTGPYALNRFLKNKKDVEEYVINEPSTFNSSLNLRGNEDFISYPSCSYMDKM